MCAKSFCACLLMLGSALGAGGCATSLARNGIPDPVLADKADIAGLPSVRYWADEVPSDLAAEIRKRLPNMPKLAQKAERVGNRPVVEVLALSGGGYDGAFGAGLLAGWTARGDRPQFEVVTGVSAGAIIAPFAYLGPRYDHQLKKIWTEYRTSELVTAQILPGLLGGPALADTAPLEQLINTYVDRRMLREIAAEYRKGRMLLVGTTNLDAERPVVWNMGEIAASRHPQAAVLFRKVLLASAAIPGAFPPVNIPVEVDGKRFEEMHVDGATTREVFVSPAPVPFKAFDRFYAAPPIRRLYIVKNGKIAPETDVVKAQAIPIAVRAISTLIKSQHMGELYRIYRMAKDAGADFNFVAVPPTFTRKPKELFDTEYQMALFNEGFELGRSRSGWMKAPPELRTASSP